MEKPTFSRRSFLATSIKTGIVFGLPTIVPSSVFGKNAPSNRINIGAIGNRRISRTHDMPCVWKYDNARIIAVCDVDSKRATEAQTLVNDFYTKKSTKRYKGVKIYTDYRQLLQNKDIDAVLISTPDHWHAQIGVDAARAGKHIYMQKPASLTIAEGRMLSDVVQKTGVIFQIGSQQRSSEQFRYAAELVLNGRIGQLKTVYVGLPRDPSGDFEVEMPIPKTFNYDMWLGSTPSVFSSLLPLLAICVANAVVRLLSVRAIKPWLGVEYQKVGETAWQNGTFSTSSTAMLTGLEAGAYYNIRIYYIGRKELKSDPSDYVTVLVS